MTNLAVPQKLVIFEALFHLEAWFFNGGPRL